MQYYSSLAAGTHTITFRLRLPCRISHLYIESDNTITIKDNLGLLSSDGATVPLSMDSVLDLPLDIVTGIEPLQFTVTTTTTTKVLIRITQESAR